MPLSESQTQLFPPRLLASKLGEALVNICVCFVKMVGQGAVTGPLDGVTNLTIGTSASESLESHENCDH